MKRILIFMVIILLPFKVLGFDTLEQIKEIQQHQPIHTIIGAPHNNTIATMAKRYVMVLFYDSRCPHCQRFAPIVKAVADHYHFKVVAITLNHQDLPSFPHSLPNTGEAQVFGVREIPSLFLWLPQLKKAYPVSVGEMSKLALITRLIQLNQDIREYDQS